MLNTTDRIIKHKTGMLNLAGEPGNVSKACQVMGYGRDTFHRYKSAVEDGGVEALSERTRRKPDPANRVDRATEDAVIKSATDFPAYGQARTSNKLRKPGVLVSPSGVRSIWLRHDPANSKARLKAPEARRAGEGGTLTEAQVQALEKEKLDVRPGGQARLPALPGYQRYRPYQNQGEITPNQRHPRAVPQDGFAGVLSDRVPKELHDSLDALQTDPDEWLRHYNHQRTHQGKMCCGRTPFQTMIEGREIWKEKFVN